MSDVEKFVADLTIMTIDTGFTDDGDPIPDTTTTDIHAELVEPVSGSYRASFLIEGVTFEQACTVASERLGPDEDYGFDYTITDQGVEPA